MADIPSVARDEVVCEFLLRSPENSSSPRSPATSKIPRPPEPSPSDWHVKSPQEILSPQPHSPTLSLFNCTKVARNNDRVLFGINEKYAEQVNSSVKTEFEDNQSDDYDFSIDLDRQSQKYPQHPADTYGRLLEPGKPKQEPTALIEHFLRYDDH